MRLVYLLFIFSFFLNNPKKSKVLETNPEEVCISTIEKELIQSVHQYRKSIGLKAVPISTSLSIVAQKHVRELNDELKDLTHSWVGCTYHKLDAKTFNCMWDMPRKLTGYPGKGYECGFSKSGSSFSATEILEAWINSKGHHHVIANKGTWKALEWNAMGVAIYGNYAVIWFGIEKDPKGVPSLCK